MGYYLAEAMLMDEVVDRLVAEQKKNDDVRLPDDKETLIRLYDCLQARRSRRMQRDFYLTATRQKLVELIMRYLDEESRNVFDLLEEESEQMAEAVA